MNRLAAEKSPYLLQHAANPVDWYPWGDEAFERARREDKPVFLSIGYSTCHWCHVMERESFEDAAVARLLNESFVCVKVDREERPDVDHVYMTVCQLLNGSGGWPLTVLLTPDRRPFFAGTYFPRETRLGRIGMLDLIPHAAEAWRSRRGELDQGMAEIAAALEQTVAQQPGAVDESLLEAGYRQLSQSFDESLGGFGTAPKFPTPHHLLFLLRFWDRSGNARALKMVEKTLQAMRRGGIHDQLGFGFHRYSTDREWLLPHFEKMLYDQALLALAYAEAFQATGKREYGLTARGILDYVQGDMTDPGGGFYSAEDADSEGVEGKFYVWTRDEVDQVLGREDAELVARVWGVSAEGNFRDEASGHGTGANVLHVEHDPADEAVRAGVPLEDVESRLESARQKLLSARECRVRPQRDDKVLTDWNGLMIAAFARSARIFDDERYAQAAAAAARFVLERLRTPGGRLLHRFRDGEAAVDGFAADYAAMVWGLVELYEATFDSSWLGSALELNARLLADFWDDEKGVLFATARDAETLLVRPVEVLDGAAPSAVSITLHNLLRLSLLTGSVELEERASRMAASVGGTVRQLPAGCTHLLSALDLALGPSVEVVVAGGANAEDTRAALAELSRGYHPRRVVLLRPIDTPADPILRLAPFVEPFGSVGGRATISICSHRQCQQPTTDLAEALALLAESKT